MTLALYGKTKRRQGGLMLAALMAILFATLGGVATLRGAGAASVAPIALPNATAIDASPTCGTQGRTAGLDSIYGGGQTWSEFKIEPPAIQN